MEVIDRNVEEQTIIITDESRAYRQLMRDGRYQHYTINHSRHFVDPSDPSIHTQNIENFWSRIKRHIRNKAGINRESYILHMTEYLWRMRYPSQKFFNHLLTLLNKL